MLTLQEIYVYPIKGLGGVRVQQAVAEPRGLRYDRRWMLVDAQGVFLTQREHHNLALLQCALTGDELVVRHKNGGGQALHLPLNPGTGHDRMQVRVWDDVVPAVPVGHGADQFFSTHVKMPVRLVYMPDDSRRAVDPHYAPDDIVSFADGYPYLLIGQASLDDLNARLALPLPMNRFRPNLVFSGGTPYQEDTFKDFKIGTVAFRGLKPCARCVVTTIDQQTAALGKEPLRTLATYRKDGNKINFGMNCVLQPGQGEEVIAVGSELVLVN
jgi:uncharacterized protein YcbX